MPIMGVFARKPPVPAIAPPPSDPPRNRFVDINPWSDGLEAGHNEIVAVAMLLGDPMPIPCSCCLGRGVEKKAFGGVRACMQCKNTGYDFIAGKTLNHFLSFRVERIKNRSIPHD